VCLFLREWCNNSGSIISCRVFLPLWVFVCFVFCLFDDGWIIMMAAITKKLNLMTAKTRKKGIVWGSFLEDDILPQREASSSPFEFIY
jgi:hypothetical protein